MTRDDFGNPLCYDPPITGQSTLPDHVKDILTPSKYLGVTTNAQLDMNIGKEKLLKKISQSIAIISKRTDSIKEVKNMHNMLVCQVATYSPLCACMTLKDCMVIDKQLLNAYQYCMKYLPNDAKHNIFLSQSRGGIGVHCYTREYVGALMRDLEVYILNSASTTTHALLASAEASTKLSLWNLNKNGKIPPHTESHRSANAISISAKKITQYQEDAHAAPVTTISYEYTHTMERAVRTASMLGFMMQNLEFELCSRFTDELLLRDRNAQAIGDKNASSRHVLGPCLGEGNLRLYKYSIFGHVYLLLQIIIEETMSMVAINEEDQANGLIEALLSQPRTYSRINCFPKEISRFVLPPLL